MNIGIASERSGLPSKTIRYYEDIGLVRPVRTDNGYRDYSNADIDRKIAALEGLRHMLHHLVEHCQGDERPDCPIINELAGKGLVQ